VSKGVVPETPVVAELEQVYADDRIKVGIPLAIDIANSLS
jgi:hypothetical protein